MPNPVLYVLPEDHRDKQDQGRKAALEDLASWDAINVLLESVLVHDTSGQSANRYGIEDEASIKTANLFRHHLTRVKDIKNLSQKIAGAHPGIPRELQVARTAALGEIKTLKQTGLLQDKTTRQELKQYIRNWPIQLEDELREKYIFYERNHKIANNIRSIVQNVLDDASKPRVFALSIGAEHIDSTNLKCSSLYQGKKDLPTILGNTIAGSFATADVIYGNQTVDTIAKKALERSDNLPWMKRWSAKMRLKVYIGTG